VWGRVLTSQRLTQRTPLERKLMAAYRFVLLWDTVAFDMLLHLMMVAIAMSRYMYTAVWYKYHSYTFCIITALHLSHEQNVRPSVCRTRQLWQNERKLCRHSYTTWKIVHPSFRPVRMVGGGQPLLPEILGQTDPFGAKTPIFNRYSVVAPQVTPSERSSINTNRKSTTRFPLSVRWTSYVVPEPLKGGSKTHNGRFRCKIPLYLNNNSFIEFCNRSNNDCWIYKHSISITSE